MTHDLTNDAMRILLAEEVRRVSDNGELATFYLPAFRVGLFSEAVVVAVMARVRDAARENTGIDEGWVRAATDFATAIRDLSAQKKEA